MLTDNELAIIIASAIACTVTVFFCAWSEMRLKARHLAEIKRMGEIAGQMTAELAAENTELREQIKELQATVDHEWGS